MWANPCGKGTKYHYFVPGQRVLCSQFPVTNNKPETWGVEAQKALPPLNQVCHSCRERLLLAYFMKKASSNIDASRKTDKALKDRELMAYLVGYLSENEVDARSILIAHGYLESDAAAAAREAA